MINDESAIARGLTALVPGYVNGHAPASRLHERVARILIIENDSYTRTALKRMLQAHYAVLEAEDQHEGLRLAKESEPNLVILNFHLPRTNIERLCTRLREEGGERAESREPKAQSQITGETSRLSIILLVDSPDAISGDQLRALGADDLVYKPLPVSVVEKRVGDLLRSASNKRVPA
jgi:DNA-binding response OmpR family regulator